MNVPAFLSVCRSRAVRLAVVIAAAGVGMSAQRASAQVTNELPPLLIPDRVPGPPAARPARTSATPIYRATPFFLTASGSERDRAVQCMTAAVYYEAANEPNAGQEAVAQVVLNRMHSPRYPNSVCAVVFQGSERRTGCQFTFTCDGSLARIPSVSGWSRARAVAVRALDGYVALQAATATHYHTRWVRPYWAAGLNRLGEIGAHVFYSAVGERPAPGMLYAGGELNVARAAQIAAPSAALARSPREARTFTVWGLAIPGGH